MKKELLENVHISKYAGNCKTLHGCVTAEIESTNKSLSANEHYLLHKHLRKNESAILAEHNGKWLEIIHY